MKFIIDRSTWRTGTCGEHKTGLGWTLLRNPNGFCCCLGQIAEQCNISKNETLNVSTPDGLNQVIPFITQEIDGKYECTNLAEEAMEINDDKNMPLDRKEERLKELFNHVFELEFIGEPVRENV